MRFLFRLSQTKYNICKSLIFGGGDFFFQIFTPVPCSSPSLCPNHWAQYYTQTDRHWAGDLIFQSQPLFLHHHTFLQIPIRRRNGIFSFVSHSQNLVKFFVCLIISFHRTKKIPENYLFYLSWSRWKRTRKLCFFPQWRLWKNIHEDWSLKLEQRLIFWNPPYI